MPYNNKKILLKDFSMRIRKYITIDFFLLIFFFVYWMIYNFRYFAGNSNFKSEEILTIINSDSKGYFSYIIISTLFTFVYLLCMSNSLLKIKEHEIIRYTKKYFINKQIFILITQTIIYAILFEIINLIMNYITLPYTLLSETKFLFISSIHLILLFTYFISVGAIFLLVNCLVSFKSISVWITAIIFCFFLGLYKFFNLEGLLIRDFCVFDKWFGEGLNIVFIFLSVIKNIIIVLICFVLSKTIFVSKDILDSKSAKSKQYEKE